MTNETGRKPDPSRSTVETGNDLNTYLTTSPYGTTWITAADLQRVDFPPLQWAIPNVLPAGIALLAGAPKLGKSTFAINLTVAVATGGKAFGAFTVDQGTALYIPLEDGGLRRVQERIGDHLGDEPWPPALHLTDNLRRLDEGGLEELDCQLGNFGDCRVVVIDTLQRVKPVTRNASARWYDEDYAALTGLIELSNTYNTSIVLVHHTREMKADLWIDSVSGSRGLSAYVDSILVAERGKAAADVVLKVTGRDIPEAEYAFDVDYTTYTWRYLGDATLAQLTENRRAVLDAFDAEGPMTPTQVAAATRLKYDNVKKLLPRMADDGLIKNLGDGTYDEIQRD